MASTAEIDLNSLKQEIFLKLVVLGDLGVGKTSLVRKYTGSWWLAARGRSCLALKVNLSSWL